MDILADLNKRDGITVLVSLHQVEYALRYCPRTVALKAGEIVYDGPSSALTPEFLGSIDGAESEDLFASFDAKPVVVEPPAAANSAVAFDLSRRAPANQRQRVRA
jgi:phosphonate transport system ATP-binding protein